MKNLEKIADLIRLKPEKLYSPYLIQDPKIKGKHSLVTWLKIKHFTLHITPQNIENLLRARVSGTIKAGPLKLNSINRPFVITT